MLTNQHNSILVAKYCIFFLFKFIFGYVTCSLISKLDIYLYPVLAYFSDLFYHLFLSFISYQVNNTLPMIITLNLINQDKYTGIPVYMYEQEMF